MSYNQFHNKTYHPITWLHPGSRDGDVCNSRPPGQTQTGTPLKSKMDRNQRINNYEPETFETHQNFEFHENHENKTEESSNNNENFDNQADQSENRTGVSKPESVTTESRNENVSFPTYHHL